MKNLLLFALPLLALTFNSCSDDDYDDSGIRRELNDLKGRIVALEELCRTMNSNISSLQIAVVALQNNDYITSYSALADGSGHQITFAQGGAIVIKHGKDGVNGTNGTNGVDGANAPVIGVSLDEGIYYWTITTNGSTDWLLGNDGNKLRVTGEKGEKGDDGSDGQDGTDGSDGIDGQNGVTPILGVDASGYWTIDRGDGLGTVRLKDSNGQEVKAIGVDGQNGVDGTNGQDGADGESIFKSVTSDNENVYFTLANDTVITIPKGVGFSFVVENSTGIQSFDYGETKTYTITQSNISNISVSAPYGWKAAVNGNALSITASEITNLYAVEDGIVSLVAISSDSRSIIVNITTAIESDYIKFYDSRLPILLLSWDTNKDGRISKTEAEQITSISYKNRAIYSFDEVGCFSSLTSLNLSNEIDKDITTFNRLTSIDVSSNINLNTLNCSRNSLTYIEIGNNSELADINVSSNRLTSLDVNGCPSLTTLNCESNSLTSLDVSNNPNLITLNCGNNDLTSLDVSNNLALTTLNCANGMPNLTELWLAIGQTIPQLNKASHTIIYYK